MYYIYTINMKNMKNTKQITQGTILYSSGGYEETRVRFYQVVNLVGKTQVELVSIGKTKQTRDGDDYWIDCTPNILDRGTDTFKRKIKTSKLSETTYVSINDREFAYVLGKDSVSETHPKYRY